MDYSGTDDSARIKIGVFGEMLRKPLPEVTVADYATTWFEDALDDDERAGLTAKQFTDAYRVWLRDTLIQYGIEIHGETLLTADGPGLRPFEYPAQLHGVDPLAEARDQARVAIRGVYLNEVLDWARRPRETARQRADQQRTG